MLLVSSYSDNVQSMHCQVSGVHYIVYSAVQYTVCSVQYTVCSVQYTVCSVQPVHPQENRGAVIMTLFYVKYVLTPAAVLSIDSLLMNDTNIVRI